MFLSCWCYVKMCIVFTLPYLKKLLHSFLKEKKKKRKRNELIDTAISIFSCKGKNAISGDQPAVRKPLLEQGQSLGQRVASGTSGHGSQPQVVCSQSCRVNQVHAWGWSKATGAVGASITDHPKMQLCVQPAIPTALLLSSGKLSETELSV